jgi:hypothetical protein
LTGLQLQETAIRAVAVCTCGDDHLAFEVEHDLGDVVGRVIGGALDGGEVDRLRLGQRVVRVPFDRIEEDSVGASLAS